MKKLIVTAVILLAAATAFGQSVSVGVNVTRPGKSMDLVLPSYAPDQRDYGVNQLLISASYTDTLWQEGKSDSSVQGVTHATADGDPIGRIDSIAGPHHVRAGTGTTDRPTLSSDATGSLIRWTRSSSQKLDVYNSKSAFRFLHDSPYTIFIQFKRAGTGTRQYLLDTSNDTVGTGNYGLRVYWNTDDTLWIDTYGGGNVTYLKQWNVPTYTFTDTASWHTLLITLDAIPGTMTCQYDSQTAQTTSVAATNQVATGQDSASDMRIGADMLGSGYYFDGSIAQLCIADSVLSAGNIASLKAYTAVRSPRSMVRYTALTVTDPSTQISPKPYIWYDFTSTTGMYKTNDTSSAVTADGDAIGRIESRGGAPLGRHASQATSNRRPTYKTSINNSKSAGYWVGAAGTGGVSQDLSFQDWPIGAQTFYLVAQNTVAGTAGGLSHEGSHFLSLGTAKAQYLGVTGTSSTNGTYPNRLFLHIASVSNGTNISMNQTGEVMATTGVHIFEYVRNGTSHNLWYDGVEVDPGATVSQINGVLSKTTLQSGNIWAPNHMGEPSGTGVDGVAAWWDLGGYVHELLVYNAVHPVSTRKRVRSYLATKYGMTSFVRLVDGDEKRVERARQLAMLQSKSAWFNQFTADMFGEDVPTTITVTP